jgi:hypothetical protein
MKAFVSRGYLLRDARLEVRLAYSGFLVLTFIGMITMAAFQLYHIGPSPQRIAAHYRGGDVAGSMTFAKTLRELVEVTHFHSFIMGLVYLVLAHLFIATTAPLVLKYTLLVVAFGGLFADLIAPWLIRYVSAGFVYLQLMAWPAEWIGLGAFVVVPIREMWFTNGLEDVPIE